MGSIRDVERRGGGSAYGAKQEAGGLARKIRRELQFVLDDFAS